MTEKQHLFVSIIIAFYNEEDYLDRCLQSVQNQTYHNLEVILINDGSTDVSLQIAEKHSKSFNFCKVFTSENLGLSEARNIGLKNATGQYVTFLDADDSLEPEMIEQYAQAMVVHNVDLIIGNYASFSEDGKTEFETRWEKEVTTLKRTKQLIDKFYKHGVSETVWAKMYKTELIKEIDFIKGIWFQDRLFVLECLFISETVFFIDEKLLKIYRRNSSITRRILGPKRIVDMYRIFEMELNIIKKYDAFAEYGYRVAKNRIHFFMDTFMIQIIDRHEIIDINGVRKVFLECLNKFKSDIKRERINLNLKDKLILQLLKSPVFLGWNLTNTAIQILKKKRIKMIRELKNV